MTLYTKYTKVAFTLLALGVAMHGSPALAVPTVDTGAQIAQISAKGDERMRNIPAVPYKVVLNQQNARVFAESTLKITTLYGQKVVLLPLPASASNVQFTMPNNDAKLLAFQTEKALPFKPQGAVEKQRVSLESMEDSLSGSLETLQAQLDAIYNPILDLPPTEAKAAMQKALPELALLGTRISHAQRELSRAKARTQSLTKSTPASQRAILHVDTAHKEGDTLQVRYSYTLPDSNWRPMYVIDANTEANTINFKLMAKVTQNSDLDWNNTQVEFSTAQGNEQAPPAVQPWIIYPREKAQARVYNSPQPAMLMAKSGMAADAEMASFNPNTALASWSLNKKITIPEGETTLILQESVFSAPLERIIRPSAYNGNTVWLSAKHKLSSDFLPVGEASYLLDGVPVGQSIFEVKDNTMNFFFGTDPLVTVDIKKDIRKSAENGLINKEQIWTWGWTYTITNKRNQAVQVRVEEPQTQLSDKAISVTYNDSPKPEKDKDETFVWKFNLPAKGQHVIKHNVTVKAPKDMPIYTGR